MRRGARQHSLNKGLTSGFCLTATRLGAGNPSYDFCWNKSVQPGASKAVFRQFFARHVRLEVQFAGSVGIAGTFAMLDEEFDVGKNGSGIGTIRYGAGATTPTFIAVAAVTLEIDDEITVVAPANVDTSLADVVVTVSGGLVACM